MPFAHGDMRDPHRFTQKRPRSFVWALRGIAVVEPAKNQEVKLVDVVAVKLREIQVSRGEGVLPTKQANLLAARVRGSPVVIRGKAA